MGISPIALNGLKVVAKPFQMLANTPIMKVICDKFEKNPEQVMALTTIASIVGKDGVGCYMYVKQSLNNEKIPEEKRSFVAALDLTNGGLMILSQLLMFFTISNKKFQNKLFGSMFNKIFSDHAKKQYITYIRSNPKFRDLQKQVIGADFDKIHNRAKDTFGFLTSLIASTTIAKRVIVPFIATPLASWAQKNVLEKDKNKAKDTVNAENKPDSAEKTKSTNLLDNYTKK